MARDGRPRPPGADPEADPDAVLSALEDDDCRAILEALDEPRSAATVSEECDIPMSTTYRKLDALSEASLVAERTELRADGHHTTLYEPAFDEVRVELVDPAGDGSQGADGYELDVEVERPAEGPSDRLASLWTEVRRET